MEKSLEQLKHIERISKQTRHHRTYLNQICEQNLHTKLKHLANEREQTIQRSIACRQLEEERKQLIHVTIQQIAKERQHQALSIKPKQIEEETIQVLSKDDESRPSSSMKRPCTGTSCRLFSHNCQLYPCQPIYEYKSIIKKENDQILRKRNSTNEKTSSDISNKYHLQELFTKIQEKKHQQTHRQLISSIHNQYYQVNRHISMQRTMNRLNEQSRLLHERLTEKKTFGYVKERQHKLSQAIQRHLKITAKFCA